MVLVLTLMTSTKRELNEQLVVSRSVVQFPAVGGKIAVACNKSDCSNLRLTQKQVADIF